MSEFDSIAAKLTSFHKHFNASGSEVLKCGASKVTSQW